ncbi:MAG TPA: helix-turn-helix domain-containing protein [Geopsychrobacteraceae bacterium]|jgi:HTH-type transcriptional regulator/antitoxin HigA
MTNTAEAETLTNSFLSFYEQASKFIDIKTNDDYERALDLVEQLMTTSEDTADNPILLLIDVIAGSIEKYEDSFEDMVEFEREADALDPAVSTLRVIMDQNKLAYADLKEEIGSKSLVSQIINGHRSLTKDHIRKLSARFHVSPELFF